MCILLRRRWLFRAPLWLATAGVLLWAALHGDWWEWLRGLVIVVAAIVGLTSVSTFLSGLAVLTRAGFWLPGPGGGRWGDVIDRDGYQLTMRVSDPMGFPRVISFERVRDWPATGRWLDRLVPRDLSTPERAEPDRGFAGRADEWTDELLLRLRERCEPPDHARRWVLPGEDGSGQHSLVVSFAPTSAGSLIEVWVTEPDELPEIKVDGCFAVRGVDEIELDEYKSPVAMARGAMAKTAAILAALFRDAPREAIPSWQILDADGAAVQFHRDRLTS